MREKGDGRERGERRCVERTGASEKEILCRRRSRDVERERERGSKGGGRE